MKIIAAAVLIVFGAVHFAVKSYFSEKMHWAVLSVLLLPALELCFEWSRAAR